MFNVELLNLPYNLNQINTDDYRYYTSDDGDIKFPSITTVLGASDTTDWSKIPSWISERAANRGTYMHDFCEQYVLNNLEIPVPKSVDMAISEPYNTAIDLFYQMKPFLDKSIDSVLMTESKLKCDKLRIAGTVDLFALLKSKNKKNVVTDFKSATVRKKHEDITGYYSQGEFYASAIEETFGMTVDGVLILISTEHEGIQHFYLDRNKGEHLKYQKYLINARKEFYKLKGF